MSPPNAQTPDPYQSRRRMARYAIPIILVVWLCAYLYYSNHQPAYIIPETSPDASSMHAPKPIIALTPSLTETLWALDIEHSDYKLVATSPFTNDARADSLIRLQSAGSLEQIVALKPALVLLHPADSRLKEQLEAMHIPTLSHAMDTIEDIESAIINIGKQINKRTQAHELLEQIHSDLKANAIHYRKTETHPGILIIVDRLDARMLQFYTAQSPAYLADLVRGCGYEVIQASQNPWARVSAEQLIELNPTSILFLAHDSDDAQQIASEMRKLYPTLHAVAHDKLFVYDDSDLSVPGPDIAHSQSKLCAWLHKNDT